MMQRTVEARGARLVLGLQRHEPRLEAHLQARHIPYTTFDGAPAYPTAGWHWTPEGNAQVAKAYLALFAEIGLLQNLSAQASGHVAPADIAFGRDQPPAGAASVLSPSIWLAAARVLPDELVELGRFLTSWLIAVSDSGGEPRVAGALLIVAALGVAVLLLWFWWERRAPMTAGVLGRSERALASFGVFFVLALPMTLSTLILLEAAQVRMIEITRGFVAGIFVAAFGHAVAIGLFAPDAPQRRLIKLDDASARALCGHFVWGARALGALILLLAIHKALVAPAAVTAVTHMLFALAVGATLVHLLVSRRMTWSARWPRAVGWLLAALIAVALLAGYSEIASVAAARLVSVAAAAAALYLVLTLGKALWVQRLAPDAPDGKAVAINSGIGTALLGRAMVLTCICMGLAVLLAVLVIYVGP
jgi:potassium-dependent mechanosensitive channel